LALSGAPSMPMLAQAAPAPATELNLTSTPAPVVTVAVPAAEPLVRAPGFAQNVVFGPRAEVVQPLPARTAVASVIHADRHPSKVALAVTAPVSGSWFVQLGAYRTTALARDGWGKAVRRLPALAPRGPSGMSFAARNVYRLSVGGFTHISAVAMCQRFRAKGGDCFVRQGAGDQVAAWVHKPVQMASR
jgi:hypothetical protein